MEQRGRHPAWAAYWLPRFLHPGAWWLWALGLAVAASRTTNPLILGLILAVASFVVMSRRTDAPWALGFRLYVWMGVFIIVMRLIYSVIFGGASAGGVVLFTLPEIQLPEAAAGIQLFGPVTLNSLLAGFFEGLRLATMLICLGAANALANPKRLLKSVPSALYEVGTAIVVALSVFPQLADSVARVRRARKLRGTTETGLRALKAIAVPVLADALDRSLMLASAMDSRGYGRRGDATPKQRRVTGLLMVAGLLGVCVGVYGVLDGSTSRALGVPVLLAGVLVAGIGFITAGRRVERSMYRPDRWLLAESLTAACGVVAGAAVFLTERIDPARLYPSLEPLQWPTLPVVAVAGVLMAVLPAWITPSPPSFVADVDDDATVQRPQSPLRRMAEVAR